MAEHPVQAGATTPVDYAAADACTAAIAAGPGPADMTAAELDALEHLEPEQLDQLARDFNAAADLAGAGFGKWPDVGNHPETGGVPCCTSSAVMGHAWCTCWVPVFDVDQAPPRTELAAGLQPSMCADCAFRPKSPERTGDDHAKYDEDDLMHLVVTGTAFWCHQGMRKPTHWHHPTGATVPGSPTDYRPATIDRTPYQADGTPGLLCAGWVAHRTKHLNNGSNTRSNDADGLAIEAADFVRNGPQARSGNGKCRVCGCTDDRACNGGCAWVPGQPDLCTRCQPLEQMFGHGGAAEPIDLVADGFDPGSGAWPTGSSAVAPTTDRSH